MQANAIMGFVNSKVNEYFRKEGIWFAIDHGNYIRYIQGSGKVGREDGGQFVFTGLKEADLTTMSSLELTKLLGLPRKDEPYYVFKMRSLHRLRYTSQLQFPTYNTPGTNKYYVPGGYTSGGVPERVLPKQTKAKCWALKCVIRR